MTPPPSNNGSGWDSGSSIASPEDRVLVTGASGFMGPRVLERLLSHGFRNVRCFVRSSSNLEKLQAAIRHAPRNCNVELLQGDLLSPQDCRAATRDTALVLHLAAGRGEKAFSDAFLNSVVTTRNLLDAALAQHSLRRFVNVSSFSVYSNRGKPQRKLLDETCPIEAHPESRGDAYSFAKVKQEQIVAEYGSKFGLPFVILRPGIVYGPGNEAIHGRVGLGTFGLFLHLGGANILPLTHVDNCAEAIILAGVKPGIDGEAFNVVDDDLPSSRRFLRLYKRNVRPFKSLYVPHTLSYLLCYLWEIYSRWSEGQLPPTFSRAAWHVYWKPTRYSNGKLKQRLGWTQNVPTFAGLTHHFESCRRKLAHA